VSESLALHANFGSHPGVDAALHARDATGIGNLGEFICLDEILPARWDKIVSLDRLALRYRLEVEDRIQLVDKPAAECADRRERMHFTTDVVPEKTNAEPTGDLMGREAPVVVQVAERAGFVAHLHPMRPVERDPAGEAFTERAEADREVGDRISVFASSDTAWVARSRQRGRAAQPCAAAF